MRVVFLGTPAFAVPSLIEIAKYHDIVAVVTQPDKIGDHKKIQVCETKQVALKLGLNVLQYNKISLEGVEELKALKPDILVTAAYGQILSEEVLNIAPNGVLNVHASILPKYRGAAPINWCLINGDKVSGVTIVKTVYALDAGDVLLDGTLDLDEDETAGQLTNRLAKVGAYLIREALTLIKNGTAVFTPQDSSQVTTCSKITADMEKIDWTKDNVTLHNLIRGLSPTPGSWTMLEGKRLKIYYTSLSDKNNPNAVPGTVIECSKDGIVVQTGVGSIVIKQLQIQGGKVLTAKEFINGRKIAVGMVLTNE